MSRVAGIDWAAPGWENWTEIRGHELAAHLVEVRPGTVMLQHPLVQTLFPYPGLKETYHSIRERAQEAHDAGRWGEFLIFHHKAHRLDALYFLAKDGAIDRDELREHLPEVWSAVELPHQHSDQLVRWLFRRAGFLADAEAQMRTGTDQPPTEPITVFRGATRRGRYGWSWTRDRSQARWFAERWAGYKGATYIWQATVEPEAVMAFFDDRNEHEVVVDPAHLRGGRVVEQPGSRYDGETQPVTKAEMKEGVAE